MLQQKPDGNGTIRLYGFLVGIEIEEGETTPEHVANRLADSVSFIEGVGRCNIESLGEITYDAETAVSLSTA